ncbi:MULTISPECIES: septation protein A [unclassified Sphingomonas]|uniref:septation protein A n=1 Tax=unclassified Sphingomonas TaxID=196159 RepID=UPI0006FEC66D|nr:MULTISPECIES: septation protein A [unclassified Sphingomonas]KQM56953.1 septation protein A [Sphingomonas sp. Leaf16]KQN09325.1 septation protein A [Sphingomonas sp. Leaf29]KQN17503.1 septation protein A [Sphingomonas sp. Leaf32]
MTTATKPPVSPLFRMALDYGPLLVFFVANLLASKLGLPDMVDSLAQVIIASTAFMIASVVAIIVSKWKTGHISPMLWLSAGLVVVFGALTLYFRDDTFIKMKPTIVYAMFSAILTFGLATGRPLLQQLLETAYPGLSATGWRKLTVNWAIFFAFMAVLNEVVWRHSTWDFWVGFKLWGAVPLTLIFAAANIPMLLRHGLQMEKDAPLPPAD